jgi:hypothetical protein
MSAGTIFIRVRPADFDSWLAVHNECEPLRAEYGLRDGPFYRDASDPGVALVHLEAENLDRALQWFKSPAFRSASERTALPERTFWIGEQRSPGGGS